MNNRFSKIELAPVGTMRLLSEIKPPKGSYYLAKPGTARLLPAEERRFLEQIQNGLAEVGPVIVDRHGNIIEGETNYWIATALGFQEMRAIVLG